ncbi:MAG TPA: hypothetical protein VHX86_01920 [Tepidisphaeraceae bacterium]|jgi:hypothetical protein|nr:hypothetical protein [Tepidisphaeraceae bacterium]
MVQFEIKQIFRRFFLCSDSHAEDWCVLSPNGDKGGRSYKELPWIVLSIDECSGKEHPYAYISQGCCETDGLRTIEIQ